MQATFECSHCGEEQIDELPEFSHIEAWPSCCGFDTYLMVVHQGVMAREGGIQTDLPKETGRPFPGGDEPTAVA